MRADMEILKDDMYLSSRVSLVERLGPEFLRHVSFLRQCRDGTHRVVDLDFL
jgi:hypothetical protein